MLTAEQIKQALRAERVLSLDIANPHGPLGLEQVAAAVAQLNPHNADHTRSERPIALPADIWRKLDDLACQSNSLRSRPVTAVEVAAAILQQALNGFANS